MGITMGTQGKFSSIDLICEQLEEYRYITDTSLATIIYLAFHLHKPIFLEGEPGVGKTEVALALSAILNTKIIRTRIPNIEASLVHQVAIFMQNIRQEDFLKKPGISETLDWAEALLTLHCSILDKDTIEQTLGCILKYREDIQRFHSSIWADPKKRTHLLTPYSNRHAE